MNTRITIDLQDQRLLKLIRYVAAEEDKSLRDVILEALRGYFSGRKESRAVMKLAEKTFEEWDNPKDADYDRL